MAIFQNRQYSHIIVPCLEDSQVVAMLNYGEMQILENFMNTLPYILYLTLINVNNLRDAIDLAKRVLTKEKLDRQLTGQSSAPFMKVSSNDSHLPQNHHNKGVTFDAMETLERNSDCIDRLTLLVRDMKMTMDRKQSPYKPKIYQGRSRNQNRNRQNFTPRNRSFSRGRNQGNYNNRNNYRPNYRNKSRGRWNNHRSGDRNNDYQNYNRQGNTRPNYRQNAQWTFRDRSQSRNRNNDHTRGRSRDKNNSRSVLRRREESRSQSNSRVSTNCDQVRCYRCQEYNHFTSKCPNTPTDKETEYEDIDPASLQMMTQNYGPVDSEGEVEYLNL